jgi:ribosomal protein S18 acetylase RimI-like enzyme
MDFKFASSIEEKLKCYRVMKQLRPHIETPEDFLKRLKIMEDLKEKFYLLYIEQENVVQCVCGFRIMYRLKDGQTIYIDDLVTNQESRSNGYGKAMMEYMKKFVKESGLEGLTLDSGVHRPEAHKFYFSQNFYISSFHFTSKM